MPHYACALILEDNKLLLGRRAPYRKVYPNCWDVIGGKVEAGEGLEQALIRELGEEIGITPTNPQYFTEIKDRDLDTTAPPSYHYFIVRNWQGTASICNHEHTDLEWFPFDAAAGLPDLALEAYRDLFARLPFDLSAA